MSTRCRSHKRRRLIIWLPLFLAVMGLMNGSLGRAGATASRNVTPGAVTMLEDWYPTNFSPTYNMSVNLGLRLITSESGYVTKVFFAKDAANNGPHTGTVWDASGNVLAQVAFTNETADGWQEVTFANPVRILAGATFTVGYSLDNHVFAVGSFPRSVNGPLTLVGQGGFYRYSSVVSDFPDGTVGTNYGIDLEFMPDSSAPATSTTTTTTTTSTTIAPSTSTTTTNQPVIVPTLTTTTTSPTTTTTVPPTTTTTASTTSSRPPSTDLSTNIPDDITDEQLDEVLTDIESGDISAERVVEVVDQILEGEVSGTQATELATSPVVLQSIEPDQAGEIFDEIPVGDLDPEQEAELVAAVSAAPTEIKNAFESSIDVYGSGLDEYVPVGSRIDVGDRRTLLAATTAVSAIAAAGAAVGTSGAGQSSGRSSSHEGRGPREFLPEGLNEQTARRQARKMMNRKRPSSTVRSRQTETILGSRTSNMETFTRIIRVVVKEISALSFTLAGSVIVYFTLSGQTRRIALIATSVAMMLHFINVILEGRADPDQAG